MLSFNAYAQHDQFKVPDTIPATLYYDTCKIIEVMEMFNDKCIFEIDGFIIDGIEIIYLNRNKIEITDKLIWYYTLKTRK